MQASRPILRQTEPKWRPWRLQQRPHIPAAVLPWLEDEGSLTRRVIRHCDGRFSVTVRSQGWGRPMPSERRILETAGGGAALIREVELRCDRGRWVFARTLIPATSLQGPTRRLAHLGNKPLGAVLFSDPGVRRERIEVADLRPHHVLFRSACRNLAQVPKVLWGRRTLFFMEGKPLLVNEIFLPELPGL